jgi:hypothetical protein
MKKAYKDMQKAGDTTFNNEGVYKIEQTPNIIHI